MVLQHRYMQAPELIYINDSESMEFAPRVFAQFNSIGSEVRCLFARVTRLRGWVRSECER